MLDRAPSTTSKYQNSFSRWRRWAVQHDLPYLPASGQHIALYLVHLLKSANSPAPIRDAVYGIAWAHKKAGYSSPTCHIFVQQVLQAALRVLSRRVKRKRPLSLSQVKLLFAKHDRPGASLTTLQSLLFIILGFSGFMRWNDLSNVKVENIRLGQSHMSIFLPMRKNDQFREGGVLNFWRSGRPTCPVSMMERFLARSQISSGYLLRQTSSHQVSTKRLPYNKARNQFLQLLRSINVDPKSYGLHSLRSGGASVAASAGAPGRLISRHGGWRSTAARNAYIKESASSQLFIPKMLGV